MSAHSSTMFCIRPIYLISIVIIVCRRRKFQCVSCECCSPSWEKSQVLDLSFSAHRVPVPVPCKYGAEQNKTKFRRLRLVKITNSSTDFPSMQTHGRKPQIGLPAYVTANHQTLTLPLFKSCKETFVQNIFLWFPGAVSALKHGWKDQIALETQQTI